MIRRLLILLLLLVLVGLGFVYWALEVPYQGFSNEAFVEIPQGTTTKGMAVLLHAKGVISSDWRFLVARVLRPNVTLQAGEYRFAGPATVREVYGKIARGETFYYELRVPEGSNIFDIGASLEKLGVMKSSDFVNTARDASSIQDIAPGAPSLEGYLFPSTYRITRHTTALQICKEMTGTFRKVWREVGGGDEGVNRSVTLASLVEKETAVGEERPRVASVYANRLARAMKLDCDPTTIYAALLRGTYRGVIHRSDLDDPHPYNTYQNGGLPPGPIANPGRESLKAALHPAETEYLYFVAKPGGVGAHHFSTTLEEHNTAVAAYRRGNKQ